MEDNVKPLRIHPDKRLRNRLGKFAVPCEVSGRWLRFREAGEKTPFGEMLYVDVMTGDPDSPPQDLRLDHSERRSPCSLRSCQTSRIVKTTLDEAALNEAATALAREMAQGYRPTDVAWLADFARQISQHATEQAEFVMGQRRDPNLVIRIVRYMTSCLAIPVIGYSFQWFMATFDALLELSCPNHGGIPENEQFYRDVEAGIASARADY